MDAMFVSAYCRAFTTRLGVDHIMTSLNHPEAGGQTEQTNRTLAQYLQQHTQQNPAAWLDFLPCAKYG